MNQNLTSASRGIYVATCAISDQAYVTQTVKNFPRDSKGTDWLGTK